MIDMSILAAQNDLSLPYIATLQPRHCCCDSLLHLALAAKSCDQPDKNVGNRDVAHLRAKVTAYSSQGNKKFAFLVAPDLS